MIITGKDLRRALKVAELTQQQAADKMGVVRQTVVNWIKSGELSPEIVQNVHSKLDIHLGDFKGSKVNGPAVVYNKTDDIITKVPVYDVEFSAGTLIRLIENRDDHYPVAWLSIPEVSGCDAVIRARGDSMKPRINDGDWLGIKRQQNWREWIPMGYIYAIDTTDQQLIKYIHRGQNADSYKIVSENKHYEDDEIPKKVINELWAVKTILPFSQIETII